MSFSIFEYMVNTRTGVEAPDHSPFSITIPIPPPRLNLQAVGRDSIDINISSSPPKTPPTRQWPSAPPPLPRRPTVTQPPPSVCVTIGPESETEAALITQMKWLETRECRETMTEEERRVKMKDLTERFRNALKMKEFFRRVAASSKESEDNLYN